jgi:YbbR domain-containing protein
VDCRVYNKEDKEITGMSGNLSVEVSVEVAKEVPVILVTKGKPADDFIETLRLVTPEKVLITGPYEQLSRINELKTEPIDIDNIKQNFSATPVIKLPEGIKFAEEEKAITASITVEKLALKDLSISKSDLRLINAPGDGLLNYEILTQSASIQLKGRMSELSGISLESLLPGLDVAGLAEGTHKLPLNIMLPSQIKLVQDAVFEVKVSKAEKPPA